MSILLVKSRGFVRASIALFVAFTIILFGVTTANASPSDGTLDTMFNTGGSGFNLNTDGVALQSDGKILVGGMFTTYNGTTANRLIRLNTNGSIDTSFVTGTGFSSGNVTDIVVLNDGSLIVGGSFTQYNGISVSRLVKLSSTGALDSTFTTNIGDLSSGQVTDILPLADGSFVALGQFTGGIIKFSSSGVRDSGFGDPGFSKGGILAGLNNGATVFRGIQQTGTGDVVVVGNFDGFKAKGQSGIVSAPVGVAALNLDGTLDTTFQGNLGTGMNTNGGGNAIVQFSDGKIVVAGGFSAFNTSSVGNIVGLNSNGTINSAFNPGGTGTNRQIDFISVDANENMVVSMMVTSAPYTFNGVTTTALTRITKSGALDTSFSAQTSSFKTVNTTSGDIYVTGYFQSYSGTSVGRFMRLTATTNPSPGPNPSPVDPEATQLANTGFREGLPLAIAIAVVVSGALFLSARRSLDKHESKAS